MKYGGHSENWAVQGESNGTQSFKWNGMHGTGSFPTRLNNSVQGMEGGCNVSASGVVNNNYDENNNKFFGIGGVNGQMNLEGGGAASRWYAANGGPTRRKMCSQGRTCPNINDMNKCQFSHDVVPRPCHHGDTCVKKEKCVSPWCCK